MPNTGDSFNSGSDLEGQLDYYAWITDSAAGNGKWFRTWGVKSASIHVKTLATGDALVVQVSNAPVKPDDTVDGITDQTITGDGTEKFVTLSKLPTRWVKVDKTGSVGAAEAYFHGLNR